MLAKRALEAKTNNRHKILAKSGELQISDWLDFVLFSNVFFQYNTGKVE
jgi:hypothetical protein